MLITRDIGQLFRGKATPFQLYSACFLGAAIGFIPDFHNAPGLTIFWLLILLVFNANLYLAGIVGLASKALLLFAMPASFHIGRILLDGPTEGLFKTLANAPVTAYFGFANYSIVGGQILAILFGWAAAFLCNRSIKKFRLKMKSLEGQETKLNRFSKKSWARILTFVFLGSGKGKKSYDELLAKRWGNPIRIWGAVLAVSLIVILYVFVTKLSDPIVASLLKNNLEQANGATVDLESAKLDLDGGRLEILGLEMADPENLDVNLFSSNRVVADISSADILRKRFSVDNLVFENSLTGEKRAKPGKVVGKKKEKKKSDGIKLPEYESLDELLNDADVWKERLSKVKQWLDTIGEATQGDEDKESLKESLENQIRALGYANVNKSDSIEGSPTFWIRNLVAKQIRTQSSDDVTLDFIATDLSTDPSLVDSNPQLSLTSSDGKLIAEINLGAAAGRADNQLQLNLKNLLVDEVASSLKSDGSTILKGGTMEVEVTGNLSSIDSDLKIAATLFDSQISIGSTTAPANKLQLPLYLRGPIDNPQIKLDSKAVTKAFAKAGKSELLRQASEKYGIETPEGEEGESLEDTAKNILGGFLKKKLDKED